MKSKIKLICFDLNQTLIKENSWLDLNIAMGLTNEEDSFLFKLFLEKIISYEEWQSLLERIYKSRGRANRKNILNTVLKYTYIDNAKKIVKYLKSKNYEIALISGAMDLLVENVAKELDIKYYAAGSIFKFDKNDYLENIKSIKEDSLGKFNHLQKICEKLNIKPSECAAVGDGENDRIIFKKTKRGITFKGTAIEKIAWKTISNLNEIRLFL